MENYQIIFLAVVAFFLLISFITKKSAFILPLVFSLISGGIMIALNNNHQTQVRDKYEKEHRDLFIGNKELENNNKVLSKRIESMELAAVTPPVVKDENEQAKKSIDPNGFNIESLLGKLKNPPKKLTKVLESEDLNFALNIEKEKVFIMNSKAINAEALVAWRYKEIPIYSMTIADNTADLGLSPIDLKDLTISNFKASTTNFKMIKESSYTTKYGTFNISHLEGSIDNMSFHYKIATLYHNGFFYQITTWSEKRFNQRSGKKFLNAVHDTLDGFELIETTRKAENSLLQYAKNYNDDVFGIEISPNQDWLNFLLDEEKDTFPVYGATVKDDSFLCYTCSIPEQYTNEQIISAFASIFELTTTELETKLTLGTINEYNTYSHIYRYQSDQGPCKSKLELVRHKDKVILLRTWGWDNEELFDTSSFWKNTSFIKDTSGVPVDYDPLVKNASANILNRIGIFIYAKQQYLKAKEAFEIARDLNPDNETYVRNIIQVFLDIGQSKEALNLIEKTIAKNPKPSDEITEQQARTLYTLNDLKAAHKVYSQLFSGSYQNNDTMITFLGLLLDQKNYKAAEFESNRYHKKFPSSTTKGWLAYAQSKNSNKAEAEKNYKSILQNTPNDTFALDGIINLYISNKNFDAAIVYSDKWLNLDPTNSEPKIKKIEILSISGKHTEAFDYAKKLSIAEPNNQQIKTQLAKLSSTLGLGDHALITQEINPVPLNQKLKVASKKYDSTSTSEEDNDALCLYSISSLEFKKSGAIKETNRIKYKIITQRGVQQHSQFQVAFYPTSEKVFINSLTVINADGEITYEGKPADYYITDRDKQMATHEKDIHIPVKSISVGSTYEITYTKSSWRHKDLISLKEYWFIQPHPILMRAVSIQGDISQIATHSSQPLELLEDTEDSKIWMQSNTPKFKSEVYSPPSSEKYTQILFANSGSSWKDVSSGYYQHISEKLAKDPKIKTLVETIVKPSDSQQIKLQKILQWVQSNITYQAIEFGPRGRMPKAASRTTMTKEGDCKDMSLLLWHMLREINIESQIALANSSQIITKEIPSEDQFNHVVLYCPNLETKIIDPTHTHLNLLQYSPYTLTNNFILPVSESGDELYFQPTIDKPDLELNVSKKLVVNDHIILEETAEIKGFAAEYYRDVLAGRSKKETTQYFTYVFSNSYPQIEITKAEINSDLNNNYEPLVITIHSKIPKDQQNSIPMLWESNYFLLSRIVDRKHRLDNHYKIKIDSSTTYEQGSGLKFMNINFDDKFANYTSTNEKGLLNVSSTIKRCKGNPEEYESLRLRSNSLIPKILIP